MAKTRAATGKPTNAADTADREFIEHLRQMAELRFREERDRARRVAVAARQRRRLSQRLAKKLGVGLEHFDALHEADWKLLQRQAKAQETAAIALLKRQHARQRAAFRNVMEHRERFEYSRGNPLAQTCLWRAVGAVTTALFPFTFNEGTAGLDPPAPVAPPPTVGNNLIRLSASAQARAVSSRPLGTPVAGMELVTSHIFEITAQQDGVLSVTAMYAPLGTIFLGAPGDCYGFGGQAHARMELFMKVRVTVPDRRPIDLPVGETLIILDEEIRAGCDGESRFLSVGTVGGESYQVINPDLTSVAAGDTIRVTAGFSLYLSSALRGSVSAHFSTRPSGLNVPVVLVKIAS